MQAITVRDVELLIKGGAKVTDLTLLQTIHKGKVYYQIEFTLGARGSEEKSILITTRNEYHRWVDLNRAVSFVRQLFPDNNEIKLRLK